MTDRSSLVLPSLAIAIGLAGPAYGQTASVALPEVNVTGEKSKDIRPVATVTQDKIDAAQPLTLTKLFQDDPAVQVPSGSTAVQKIYVHGIDQSKLNVTIDGASQRNNMWHHNGNLTLDPLFLKSVEVDAGVGAADNGPGALGGAVRMTTKSAADMLLPGQSIGGTVIGSYSSNSQTFRATGAGYAAKEGFQFLGIATRAKGEDYENGNGVTERGTGTDFLSGLAKLSYQSDRGHFFQLSGERAEDEGLRRLRPNMALVANPTGSLLNDTKATRTTVTFQYEDKQPTDLWAPKAEFYFNRNALNRPNTNKRTTAHGAFNSDIETIGGKLQNSFAIPTGTLTTGVDFAVDQAFVERFHFTTNAEEEVGNIGGFVQARLSPADKLRLSTGVRLDGQRYKAVDGQTFENAGLSPNISAEYDVTSSVTAFGGYSYVWGGLELAETALFHAANYRYASDLDPVTSHNLRAGLRYQQEGFKAELAGFYTAMRNPVAFNYATRTRVNGEDLTTRGFDVAISQDWGHAGVGLKYTFSDVQYGDRIALAEDYNTAVPVGHLIGVRGHYTFQQARLTLGASADFAFEVDDAALRAAGFKPLEAYQLVNLYAEWKPDNLIPNWSLRLEANNLFDEAYSARSTYGQSGVVTPLLAEGRTFFISSVLKF